MNFSKFQKSAQSPQPIYLLASEQEYLKKQVRDHCAAQVDEETRVFNWSAFDLQKDSVAELLDTARTLPWMAPRRWIYAKNADLSWEAFSEYLKNPCLHTVLILEVKRIPSKWPALPVIQVSERLDCLRWVRQRAASEGYQIEPDAAQALVDLVGEDLQSLDSELEKQFLWQLEGREITLDSVMEMTFLVRGEEIFALIDAIASRQAGAALHILNRLCNTGMSSAQILSMLYLNFRRLLVAREMLDRGVSFQRALSELKIWSYKGKESQVRQYSTRLLIETLIRLCEADRLLKTTQSDSRAHLERVVVDTCRAGSL